MGVDHRGDRISGIVKAINELKAERNQQRQSQQKERQIAGNRGVGFFNIIDQVKSGEGQPGDQQNEKQRFAEAAALAVEIGASPG